MLKKKKIRHKNIDNKIHDRMNFIIYRVDRGQLSVEASCHNGCIEKRISRAQHRSHTSVSVNANSFWVQCSVIVSAVLTRDGVLHYLSSQVKFYSLSFHVIDIKHLFQRNKLLYYLERCLFTEYVG